MTVLLQAPPRLAATAPAAWRQVTLRGWGRLPALPAAVARPERLRELAATLHPPAGATLIAQGAGRSYGDAALNGHGAVVRTTRLDRMLAFDAGTGVLVAEPGVTFGAIMHHLLPRGWLPPTPPGTAFVTLGGAVANDVHGKNQHHAGSFGEHLEWLELLLPDGRLLRVSATEEPALFHATIGGIGLTGIITAVALRLLRVPSNALVVRRRRIADLDAFLHAFPAEASWSVGWIDALAGGRALGRGVLETAETSETGLPEAAPRPRRMPLDAPGWLLNPLAVRAFNAAYWRRAPREASEALVPYGRFLHPLDGMLDWNRLYGRRGFHQFQCVLPDAAAPTILRRMLQTVQKARQASFLAVLKRMGRPGTGLLSFAMPGWSLALDIPARPGARALLAELEELTLLAEGRIYLAKDSALSPAGFARMYPGAAALRALRAELDPRGVLGSDMARRLGMV